ncbi:Uncharacterised protein [Vibrio cholerae]|nr:Uncharacterised protein [Vibrio cholerae]
MVFCSARYINSISSQASAIKITTNGIPNAIHSANVIKLSPTKYFNAIALGGVPMGVPIPPILAATGIQSANATRPGSLGPKTAITGVKIESIMAVVAVFDINIENTAVIIIKPNITYFGLLPNGLSSTRAKLTSSRYLVAAIARKKPPKNSMIIGLAKVAMISVDFSKAPNSLVPSPNRNKMKPLSESISTSSTMITTDVE